jgi:hypothetical protein
MADEEWILIDTVQGQLQAEILRGLMEAQGIMVWMNSQGAAHAYALSVGTLGAVELLVPTNSADQARQILEAYYRGDFNDIELGESDIKEETDE